MPFSWRKTFFFLYFLFLHVNSVCIYDSKVTENNHLRLSLLIILWYQDMWWVEWRITDVFIDIGKNRRSFFIGYRILEHLPVSRRKHIFSHFFLKNHRIQFSLQQCFTLVITLWKSNYLFLELVGNNKLEMYIRCCKVHFCILVILAFNLSWRMYELVFIGIRYCY